MPLSSCSLQNRRLSWALSLPWWCCRVVSWFSWRVLHSLDCRFFRTFLICHLCGSENTYIWKQQKTLNKINQYVRENLMGLPGDSCLCSWTSKPFRGEKIQSVWTIQIVCSNWLWQRYAFCARSLSCDWLSFGLSRSSQARRLQIGDLVAFISIVSALSCPSLFLSNLFTMYPRTAVSSERLKEIMEMPISIDPK